MAGDRKPMGCCVYPPGEEKEPSRAVVLGPVGQKLAQNRSDYKIE